MFACVCIPIAVKYASVSRWACKKRRHRNSPCMRVDVLMIAGKNVMFWLLTYWR